MDVGVRNGNTVDEAIRALASGGLVIVVDDESRENEGDFVVAAQFATATAINTMISEGRGLVCVAAADEIVERLKLPQMVESNDDAHGTAFTVSVDALGTGTGISAADRALTVRTLADPATAPGDLQRPGHVFPLRAVPGGVRQRRGHTEASVELAALAGLAPAAAICEILGEDGAAADRAYLAELAERLGVPLVSVADLVAHVETMDVVGARLPTAHGVFTAIGHRDESGTEHLALVMGDLASVDAPLVRVHSECLTGDVLGSWRCDCGDQLDLALARIAEVGVGAVLYVRGHEGRGIGLVEKMRAYALQDRGWDTVEANVMLGHPVDARDFAPAVAMLRMLDVERVRLLSNNPDKQHALERSGIEVTSLEALQAVVRSDNEIYLDTKRRLLGHRLPDPRRGPEPVRLLDDPADPTVLHPGRLPYTTSDRGTEECMRRATA